MAEFPSEIMHNIFSRLPVRSLAHFRCVSKQWCNYIDDSYLEIVHAERASYDRMLIMFQQFPSDPPNSPSPCILSFLEYKDQETGSSTLEVIKKPPVMEFMCTDWYFRYQDMVLGSCNGLLYSPHAHRDSTSLIVINPLRKELYELPPINSRSHLQESWWSGFEWSCGLGFDESTNGFKMVCVLPQDHTRELPNFEITCSDLCTIVHVLGSDSWTKIPLAPSYPICGEGVYAHGCLHWLSRGISPTLVIRFDVKNEVFELIDTPKKPASDWVDEQLVDFLGQVGFVYTITNDSIIELWILKEKEWVMHGQLKQKPPLPNGPIRVLGLWNENGDVLVTNDEYNRLFVCNLKRDSSYEANFVGWEEVCAKDIRMYQSSLFSTRYSIKH